MGGDETHQRVETLKTKRQNERIHFILSAAGKGDLPGLKHALKVNYKHERETFLACFHAWYDMQGESVNTSDLLKRTPLHVAASEGQVRAFSLFIFCLFISVLYRLRSSAISWTVEPTYLLKTRSKIPA